VAAVVGLLAEELDLIDPWHIVPRVCLRVELLLSFRRREQRHGWEGAIADAVGFCRSQVSVSRQCVGYGVWRGLDICVRRV
jgi:hypothetical protein